MRHGFSKVSIRIFTYTYSSMDRTPGRQGSTETPEKENLGTPTHYGLGEGPGNSPRGMSQGTPQGQGLRLENLFPNSPPGSRSPVNPVTERDSIDEILIELVEGKKVEHITHIPAEYFGEGIQDEEDTDTDLFTDIFLEPEAQTELLTLKETLLTEQEKTEASAEDFTDLNPDKYESIDIHTGGETGDIIEIEEEVRPVRTRDKRMSTPSGKIREIQRTIEEERQIKEILSERKILASSARKQLAESRAKLKEIKEKELAEKYDELPEHEKVNISEYNYNRNNNASSTGTVQGITKKECVEAGLVLTREQRTEGGSDFSMMRFLHCPSTEATPEAIGELPECVCWLCGFPMLTRSDIRRETIMIKRNLGQVSPEHTLPMTAGNALIGLPTRKLRQSIKGDSEYQRDTLAFLKKGLTYSHFWCNEVKNALRLVTWPQGELPKPNTKNINWLLNYMWHGINRGEGINRWFDEKACFVLYTSGQTNYKFSNLIHYFVLKPHVTDLSKEIIERERDTWLDARRRGIYAFLQDVCNDIKRYTILHYNKQNKGRVNTIPDVSVLSETLKIVYKDRVIKGPDSKIEWPPRSFSGEMRVKVNKRTGTKKNATGKINPNTIRRQRTEVRRTTIRNSKINKIRKGPIRTRRRR